MEIGKYYLVKCGWGDTIAKLEYIVGNVYHFKSKKGFKFITNGLSDVEEINQ